MLHEIRQLLEDRGAMALADLAVHFDIDPPAMEGMLDMLVRKGVLVKRVVNCREGCRSCPLAAERESCDRESPAAIYEVARRLP